MKKSIILVAAATLALGLASCTDEPIIDPTTGNEIVDNPIVKSVDDLKGTEWTYNLADNLTLGDVEVVGDLSFGLTFDEEYAHLSFPENTVMLSANEDLTVEELSSMNFAYTYEMATTSGSLVATDNDITGQTIDLSIPFRYDEATDAILIDFNFGYEGSEDAAYSYTVVFHRK